MENSQSKTNFLEKRVEFYNALLKDKTYITTTEKIAHQIINTYKNSGTVYCVGNGGSQCQSSHFATELLVRYTPNSRRPSIPSTSLSSDSSIITACANDFSFEEIFSNQISAFATTRDMFIFFSTSGKSQNIIKAIDTARAIVEPTQVALILGNHIPEKYKDYLCNVVSASYSASTALIQEFHLFTVHSICEILERNWND